VGLSRRKFLGFDIAQEFCAMSNERIAAVSTAVPVKEARAGQMSLLERKQ